MAAVHVRRAALHVAPLVALLVALLATDSPESVLASHGISYATWRNGSAIIYIPEPEFGKFALPHLRHWPVEGGERRNCGSHTPTISLQTASLALMKADSAYTTFEGFSYTSTGAVFSALEDATVALIDELVTALPHFFRLSRECPPQDAVRMPCCLSVKFQSLINLSFNPYLHMDGIDLMSSSDIHVKPDQTMFFDELKLFGARLRDCHTKRLNLSEPVAPAIFHKKNILAFQHVFANNYFHFLAQTMPRLLRLLVLGDEVLSDPSTWLLVSGVTTGFTTQLLAAAGLSDRLIPYDPCSVYHADTLYFAVIGSGQILPNYEDVGALKHLMMRIPPIAPYPASPEYSEPLPSRYIVLLDRSDATPRIQEDGLTTAIPRHLTNIKEVSDALQAALSPQGVHLKIMRSGELPLAEQVRWISNAKALIGVHGAGLTNVILLSRGSAVLELVPSDEFIPNNIETELSLPSYCGFTMFWYLTNIVQVPYFALLLQGFKWEDSITLAPQALVPTVLEMLAMIGHGMVSSPMKRKASQPDEL